MATALPVVTTSTGGIGELIANGKNGFLVPAGSPKELAERLKELLCDESLRKSVGAAARETVCTRFDNRETIEPLIELFRNEACIGRSDTKSDDVISGRRAQKESRSLLEASRRIRS
jgi:glycosyltransferase involved in cell wall biosynthesis